MWTFDRYQRWMEQKTDWIRPPSARPATPEEAVTVVNVPKTAPAHSGARAAGPGAKQAAPEQPAEIIDEEMDLDEIAELAWKFEERTR